MPQKGSPPPTKNHPVRLPPQRLIAVLPPAVARADDLDAAALLPADGGAYLLAIRLNAARTVHRPGASGCLAPGWYLYAGSAYGPGGIRARAARHLIPGKRRHWHVDQVTAVAASLTALAYPGASECALAAALAAAGLTVPIPGFGASDCRRCESHLLAW